MAERRRGPADDQHWRDELAGNSIFHRFVGSSPAADAVRVLAIDGGGIRGILPALVAAEAKSAADSRWRTVRHDHRNLDRVDPRPRPRRSGSGWSTHVERSRWRHPVCRARGRGLLADGVLSWHVP